jgi:DeoR family glycerol-3-phosphate regulon repressor
VIQADRISSILATLEERGACSTTDLATLFGVSDETVRRDIRQLEATGRVHKVHGGVKLIADGAEPPYRARLREQAPAKKAIARLATGLLDDGMTIFIDSGTTSYWVARELGRLKRLTIVTNSLSVAADTLGRAEHRLFLAGGALNTDYRAAFDADAIAYTRRFAPDAAILSMGAIEATRGFLDFEPDEAAYKRAILDRARRVLVVADHSKFDRRGSIDVCGFAEVDDLVTDLPLPPGIARVTAAAKIVVHVVDDLDVRG